MTCVVGLIHKGKVWMGGDSCASDPTEKVIRRDPKIFTNGDFIIGFAGSYRFGQILRFHFEAPDQDEGQGDYEYLVTDWLDGVRAACKDGGFVKIEDNEESFPESSALIGFNGKLYVLDSDLQIGEPCSDYYAIGVGSGVALGALHVLQQDTKVKSPKCQLQMALEAAATYAVGVEGPFTILSK